MNYDVSVGMQQRIIPNKQGQKLVGVFHDTGSEKLAVLCHGFRSKKVCKLVWFLNSLVCHDEECSGSTCTNLKRS